jgi:biopolymer transport protein ExbB
MQVHSVLDFILKGGPVMLLIVVCSLVALAVIVERLIVLRRRNVMPPAFLESIKAVADDRTRALDLCNANSSPSAHVLAAAIKRRGEPLEAIEKAVAEAGRREIIGLRQRMRLLGALPQVATMLGLLGTIFGMIKTFQAVAASGQALGKTETLARGIFEAWTNTAAGLLVAIPVLIAYHVLLGRIDGLVVGLDRMAVDFVENHAGRPGVAPQSERPRVVAGPSIEPSAQPPAAVQPVPA